MRKMICCGRILTALFLEILAAQSCTVPACHPVSDHDAADMQSAVSRMLLQALPPTPTESSAPDDIKAAPVANQSATAAAAVILVMNLYGSSLAPFGRSQQAALVNVLGNTTNSVPANTKLLSVSEYTPNNTTPSSPAARRHLLFHRRFLARQRLHQSSDDSRSYVKIQMAFLTTGAVAAQLQQQLLSSRSGTLMKGLQQAGVAASSIVFSSLDVQQPPDPSLLADNSPTVPEQPPSPSPNPGASDPPALKSAAAGGLSGAGLGAILGVAVPLVLGLVLVSLVYIMYRKSPYTAFGNSMQGPSALFHGTMGTPPPGSGPSPHQTSGPLSDGRQSLDATRRARSESASQYTSVRSSSMHMRPSDSTAFLGYLPEAQLARQFMQQPEALESRGSHNYGGLGSRNRWKSGELSIAAHAELLAVQLQDNSASAVVADANIATLAGSGNTWHSTGTSSSSQTQITQRLTRLDTAAWQIAYHELKFSRVIGEGSFGRVFLGKWRETTVAIKLLTPTMQKHGSSAGTDSGGEDDDHMGHCPHEAISNFNMAGMLDELDKEAGIMAALRHPNVVMFLGVCLEPPCMVAEFCARGSLHDVLTRASRNKSSQPLGWVRRLNMALDAAKGMLYLHMCQPPILHRDLKSANLLVSKHWKVKVADFNLSRVMEASSVASSIAATNPRWVAPEVLAGGSHTPSSDVYAFGIILWEMLTWQIPWDDLGPWQVVIEVVDSKARPEVPPMDKLQGGGLCMHQEYLELMRQCWSTDAEARPSFEAIIACLRVINNAETQLAGQSGDHLDKQSSDGFQRLISPSDQAGLTDGSPLLTNEGDASPTKQLFDDILNATKAAQALVEKAHKEIERSHIQPVLSLAALDAQIPLSMLRLPSDPASDSSMHRPQRQGSNDDAPSSLTSQALTGCLRSPTTSAREGLRTVSWKSLQLEQVIQEVCAEEKSHRGASADLTKPPSGSLSNTPLHQAGASRAISPFAAAAVPRIPS